MKIAIVNDLESSLYRLRFIIEREPDWEIMWQAKNGEEAVEQCAKQVPDLILMDLLMPVMNGVESTRQIMNKSPCAILVVTAGVEKNTSLVFEALGNGALDAVDMPDNESGSLEVFIQKIRSIGKLIDVTISANEKKISPVSFNENASNTLIAIGSSTGGPSALSDLLSQFPANCPASIVIIQHVDQEYAAGLASWLNTQTKLEVRVAIEGERPQPGQVLVAKTNDHLILKKNGTLSYTNLPEENIYRPSVDEFFASVGLYWNGNIIAVQLTGMGRDGAKGLLALRRLGAFTFTQDEASSTVYGMPQAAANIGAATEQQSPEEIAKLIVKQLDNTTY